MLFAAANLSAFPGAFVGLGMETNANTREGAAFGGGLSLGLDITPYFGVGIKTSFSHNADTVGALEPSALFRYYLPIKNTNLFFQADLGAAIFFEAGKSYPAFLAGLTAGWRFPLTRLFYLEPTVRGGYPFAWGVGVGVGIYFDEDLFATLREKNIKLGEQK